MRHLVMMFAIAAGAAGCTPTVHETLALSCSDYIGKPISTRIAALGPPRNVYRIDPMQVGYVFESRETTFIGGEPYYTVNYLAGPTSTAPRSGRSQPPAPASSSSPERLRMPPRFPTGSSST